MTEIQPFSRERTEELLAISRTFYGTDSGQGQLQRFRWLYEHNPLSMGPEADVMLAISPEGAIVGSECKTRQLWAWNGERIVIPTVHDYFIIPEYRHGEGLLLTLEALAKESKAALFCLSPMAEKIYSRMHCPVVPFNNLNKVISYRNALTHLFGFEGFRPNRILESSKALAWTTPPRAILESIINIPYSGACHLEWTPDTFHWRFFDPLAPVHVLVLLGKPEQPLGRGVFCIGRRKKLLVARMVDAAVVHPSLFSELFSAMEWAMKMHNIAYASAFTTSVPGVEALHSRGWKPAAQGPSRFYHKGKMDASIGELWGGSTDIGYDAIYRSEPETVG